MNTSYPTELEEGLTTVHAAHPAEAASAAVLVGDPLGRRLIEAATVQLGLTATAFDAVPQLDALDAFELIIADEPAAERVRSLMAQREQRNETLRPALVAVRPSPPPAGEADPAAPIPSHVFPDTHFDGVLALPLSPAAVASQLSLIVYAHRAFARRYHTALEELHLNRRIFRSVTSGISVANAALPDLPLVYVNPAFEVMTGYCLEEVQGRNCRFLQGAETDQAEVDRLREAIRDQREVLVVLRNFRKDGKPFWNELSLSPIRNREGELTHFVGIQTDVTARVEFEAALRESEKLAAVGRLASSIAHEINNPLESVMNLLYLTQQELENPTGDRAEALRYVAHADKELRRVALITSQSLRFFKQSTRPQHVTGDDLFESVLDLYEGRATNASVTLERRERARGTVFCLESEIRQVLNNLVRNALDAMTGRGGTLRIRTRDATDWRTGRRGIVFTIADEGTGIASGTLERMFKPFFTTKGIAGTGLGLWISREIIDRHDGRLLVRTHSGSPAHPARKSGTAFALFLPGTLPVQDVLSRQGEGAVNP